VFLEAWRKRQRVEVGERGVLPWLLGVAVNVMRNERRTRRRYRSVLARIPPLDPERDFADDAGARIDAQADAARALARLRGVPPRERAVIGLLAAGLTTREIATALAIPEATVRTRLHRLRRRLGVAAERPVSDLFRSPEEVNCS
ncbi:MAG TPA: sigma-70 family RNA polymerase sigma factor, partial [Gaiellaceae bacterium]